MQREKRLCGSLINSLTIVLGCVEVIQQEELSPEKRDELFRGVVKHAALALDKVNEWRKSLEVDAPPPRASIN
jgi:hypothetical protein